MKFLFGKLTHATASLIQAMSIIPGPVTVLVNLYIAMSYFFWRAHAWEYFISFDWSDGAIGHSVQLIALLDWLMNRHFSVCILYRRFTHGQLFEPPALHFPSSVA